MQALAQKVGVSQILANLLVKRGLGDPAEAERYLTPQLEDLHSPFLLNDIREAVERVGEGIARRERMMIIGHDDVDGVTSTLVMMKTLKSLHPEVDYYIPDRNREGYGFSKRLLEHLSSQGVKLIITVDSGTSDFPGVEWAKALGIEVIITDHHEPQGRLPAAWAVINPKREDSTYPFRYLAGVGVALKFSLSLLESFAGGDKGFLKEFLPLVALGTIADKVPLVGENRVLAKLGTEELGLSTKPGIRALRGMVQVCPGLDPVDGIVDLLRFGRFAAGKSDVVELLSTRDSTRIEAICKGLKQAGRQWRKAAEEAGGIVRREAETNEDIILAVVPQIGVNFLGYCAGLLSKETGKPAVVIGKRGDVLVGEGRSPQGFDLFQAFSFCRDCFIQYGGHKQAAGFSMRPEELEGFIERIRGYARSHPPLPSRQEGYDLKLSPKFLNEGLISDLKRLSPFGQANPEPKFLAPEAEIQGLKEFYEGERKLSEAMIDGQPFLIWGEPPPQGRGDLIYSLKGKHQGKLCLRIQR